MNQFKLYSLDTVLNIEKRVYACFFKVTLNLACTKRIRD
jgi:hypothetical protein